MDPAVAVASAVAVAVAVACTPRTRWPRHAVRQRNRPSTTENRHDPASPAPAQRPAAGPVRPAAGGAGRSQLARSHPAGARRLPSARRCAAGYRPVRWRGRTRPAGSGGRAANAGPPPA
ncbi:hypothetical protein G6F31_019180 [Rhizopus arrhizus]|nr:hypothetical protein G6F31_019180 [Rhizopus arrhizus]